jgi:hypothetical protein
MIELRETHISTGTHGYIVGLRTASVEIRPDPGSYLGPDAYQVTTRRGRANGSVRHSYFPSYSAAVEYALGYANRIAKEKREKDAHA